MASGNLNGGVKIVNDSSLGPWTYGSYNNFNTAGSGLANRAISPATYIDLAELTLAGLPIYNLGDIIGQSANITGLSVQYSKDGVTTSYSLRTFAYPSYRLTKLLTDKITSAYNKINYVKRDIVDLNKQLVRQDIIVTNTKKIDNSLSDSKDYGYLIGSVPSSADGILR